MLACASPSIKRHKPVTSKDTVVTCNVGVPKIILKDVMKETFVQSSYHHLFFKDFDHFKLIKPASVVLEDILKSNPSEDCFISKCHTKNCKTCNILITDNTFTSNLTKKTYRTRSFDDLSCKSSNIIYGLECSLCGLLYVGETKGQLNKRMNGHRSQINLKSNQLLYSHFNQPGHSVVSLKVRILEKIYHPSNSPNLSTAYRRKREEHWIRLLGTAFPYGCNDKIDSVGNMSSPKCSSTNVMRLFPISNRRSRSHGHKHYNRPVIHNVTFDSLVPTIQKPLGVHHIRTKLYSLPLSKLHVLLEETKSHNTLNSNSLESRVASIVIDISYHRLFKPTKTNLIENTDKRNFMHIHFANKGLDAINLSNIFHQKSIQEKIPPYFKQQSAPIISYSYTSTVSSKIFNHRKTLQQLNIDDLRATPPNCSCSSSAYNYMPINHVITGDLSILDNATLRDTFRKGAKYWEHKKMTGNISLK